MENVSKELLSPHSALTQKHIHARLRNDYDDDDDDDVKKERGAGNRNNETYYVNFVIELKRK